MVDSCDKIDRVEPSKVIKGFKKIVVKPECDRCGLCCQQFLIDNCMRDGAKLSKDEWQRFVNLHEDVVAMEPEDRKEGELSLLIWARCRKLDWEERDGKKLAVCTIYDDRPLICRNYACPKSIKRAAVKAAHGLNLKDVKVGKDVGCGAPCGKSSSTESP